MIVTAEKRKVFRLIFSQFEDAWKELDHLFIQSNINDIYEKPYLDMLQLNKSLTNRKNIDFKELAQIDIIYSIIFFGLSKEGSQTIIELYEHKYKQEKLKSIISYCCLKPKKESDYWDKWELISKQPDSREIFSDILKVRVDPTFHSEKLKQFLIPRSVKKEPYSYFYPNKYEKYYGGHQFRLGHYFRHLYQTTNFINKERHLSFKEKYSYIKILRGQLSNYEQLLLFLNSLSEIGRAWELMNRDHPEIEKSKDEHLITQFNLIKNMPKKILADKINVLNYYPGVKYEMFS